jgi:hypothetical protein
MRRLLFVLCCVLPGLAPMTARAQTAATPVPETREETLKLAREEKQKSVTPYQPNGLERGMKIANRRWRPCSRHPTDPS